MRLLPLDGGSRWLRAIWLCIAILCFVPTDVHGQGLSEDQHAVAMALLDSINYYRLRDPARALKISQQVLDLVPEGHGDSIRFSALLHCANSQKMLLVKDEALRYCDRAIQLAIATANRDFRIRANFMKATIFSQWEMNDSSTVYYQQVVDLDYPDANPFYICTALTEIGVTLSLLNSPEQAEDYFLRGYACSKREGKPSPFALVPLIRFYAQQNNPKQMVYLDTLVEMDFFKKQSPEALQNHIESFLFLDTGDHISRSAKLTTLYSHALQRSNLNVQITYGLLLAHQLRVDKEYSATAKLLNDLLEIAKRTGSLRVEADVVLARYQLQKETGRIDEALQSLERYSDLYARFMSEENRNAIQELNVKYGTAQKEKQIELQEQALAQAQKNRIWLIALLILAGIACVFIFLFLRHRIQAIRKLSAQTSLLHEQEKAMILKEKEFDMTTAAMRSREAERNRIAKDLHDDIGSTMSSIRVFASAAQKAMDQSPDMTRDMLHQIDEGSRQAMDDMSDIVWAINTGMNGQMTLEHKLKNYGYELLTPLGIHCRYEIDPVAEAALVQIEVRRNVLMIAKEAMNNIAKYSGATESIIILHQQNGSLLLQIEDNGSGLPQEAVRQGNGIRNMKHRTESLGGIFTICPANPKGVCIRSEIPLANISEHSSLQSS